MKVKFLGLATMLASPFLYFDLLTQDYTGAGPEQSALLGFVFMTGMICAVTGLYLIEAAGPKGRWLLLVQLGFLSIAQAYHINVMVNGETFSNLQAYLEWFRPTSYLFMLVIGFIVATSGKLKGFKAFGALITGLWAPLAVWIFTINPSLSSHVAGLVSLAGWMFTGWVIYRSAGKEIPEGQNQFA